MRFQFHYLPYALSLTIYVKQAIIEGKYSLVTDYYFESFGLFEVNYKIDMHIIAIC